MDTPDVENDATMGSEGMASAERVEAGERTATVAQAMKDNWGYMKNGGR
jgi:hypothetical protein